MHNNVRNPVLIEPADQPVIAGVLAGDKRALAKAITLVESSRADHQAQAQALLDALLPYTGKSLRVGISGAPGVGKSTFIEALGLYLISLGHRVAVLAVDPSSAISGGSILGDKTRMERLAVSPSAFIRPSPSSGALGGVAEKTREALLVCEATGFDIVIVETVGVGQSETAVAGLTDVFVLLQQPNAGDDLQAIKRGIVEMADIVVINKADLDPPAAEFARQQFAGALTLLRARSPYWHPPVLAVSALLAQGVDHFWTEVERYRATLDAHDEIEARRRIQALDWMWTLIDSALRQRFRQHPQVQNELSAISSAVAEGEITPNAAANSLLAHLKNE